MSLIDDAIREANHPDHRCREHVRPCRRHESLHCLACCIRDKDLEGITMPRDLTPEERVRKVWTRQELVDMVLADPAERTRFRVLISPKLLLLMMDYQQARRDESCELVMVYGDPNAVDLKFFYADKADVEEVT